MIFWGRKNIAGKSSLKIPYGTIAVKGSQLGMASLDTYLLNFNNSKAVDH